jgi:hypothetical protein
MGQSQQITKMTDKNRFSLTVYLIIILAATFTEVMAFINEGQRDNDFFSIAIGLVGYFGLFMHSQQIINKNDFKKFGLVGLAIFAASIIKQSLTGYHQLPLLTAGLPALYIVYFKLMTLLFYRDFPKTKPVIVYASKTGTSSYQGDDQGYKPTMKEKLFSLLLFFGFLGTAFGLILIIKELAK